MKMENPILSTADGVVKEIRAKVGDEVETDDVLVVIE
jgi:biotin carboxyl carrier protein